MKAKVRTILGDIDKAQIGLTYSHEHIVIDEGFVTAGHPEFLLNDEQKISKELMDFKKMGGQTVVDTMPANAGRNPILSAKISRQTGVHMIIPTGIHLEQYYPKNHWRYKISQKEMTQLFVDDITIGMDAFDYSSPIVQRTDHKAGLIKLATGDDRFTKHQNMVFESVVDAHLETGAPILTHTNFGKQAFEQAKKFKEMGANLRHVVLSHVDRNLDLDEHRRILDLGVSLEYDSFFRWKGDQNHSADQLISLIESYPDQIVVGMDMAKNAYWKSYGGQPGLTYLYPKIKELLYDQGLGEYVKHVFFTTPSAIFSFFK
ncbi:aryldialkylphosphatase [Persicobacter psychrovividus]|uniref:Phosphotriesterase n=1 Tax=Persicobacter psychrovividus TaxID=387638 RepID=A0ABM7VJS1_9BACT|nr:phosphotriesterase [Persicobacter psychrovividus]